MMTNTLFGVIGWPVSHSLSPVIHMHWLKGRPLPQGAAPWSYVPLPVQPEKFESAVRALPDIGFRGVNVTLPHKERAVGMMDANAAAVQATGALNTIQIEGERLIGHNTDVNGFAESLHAGAPDWVPDHPALVIGAGGAARAVIYALCRLGVPEIRIRNRTRNRAERIAAQMQAFDGRFHIETLETSMSVADDINLIVNTTSLGMRGQPALELDLSGLRPGTGVMDIVYTPLETALLRQARGQGLVAIDGLGMLLHQAAAAQEIWLGERPPIDSTARDVAEKAIGS